METLLRNYILVVDNRYYNYRYDRKGLKTLYDYASDETRASMYDLEQNEMDPFIKTHIFLWQSPAERHNRLGSTGTYG